jgi:adenine/guanine phosphoribosyltransferase-like PRPP-binding protein
MLLKEDGAFDISPVVFDTQLLRVVGRSVPQLLEFADIQKILTPAADGIPLAVQIGNVLDVDVVIAKGRKEIGVDEFYEERASYVPSVVKDFYVPKTALRRGDLVLLVDDFIRTGVTLQALVRLVDSAQGSVASVFALASIGDIDSLLENRLGLRCPVQSLITIPE